MFELGVTMFDTEDEKESGEGRGLDVDLGTNMDFVPSTKRPPRGGASTACRAGALGLVGRTGDDGPAPGD